MIDEALEHIQNASNSDELSSETQTGTNPSERVVCAFLLSFSPDTSCSPCIVDAICAYYQSKEHFKECPNSMTLSADKLGIDAYFGDGTVYGAMDIDDKHGLKFAWSLRLSTMDTSIVAIGIDASQHKCTDEAFHDCNAQSHLYALELLPMGAHSFKYQRGSTHEEYGCVVKDGDEITMELDVKRRTLRYYNNGADQGIAFEKVCFPDGIRYRLAVYAWKAPSITLTEFRQVS